MKAKPHLGALLRFEIGALVRARFTWVVFILLLAAMIAGAVNGQSLVDEQRRVVERIIAHQARALDMSQASLARYSQPAATQLPYWQDPGDVAGYMRYGLTAFAFKPPAALGALAVGQSRLLPYYLRSELDFVAPPASDFDFVTPRVLALGEFDLAFVLVCVLPLALIALGAARLSTERDTGTLALMAAQLTSLRVIVLLKGGALAVVSVPVVLAACAVALVAAGVPFWTKASVPVMAQVAVALAAFTLAWIATITLVASRTGMLASCLRLIALWMGLTFLVPAAGALAIGLAWPVPPALEQLDSLRHASNLSGPERDAIFLAYLEKQPAYGAAAERISKVPYATKMIAVQLQQEERARPHAMAAQKQANKAERAAALLRYLSPPMVFEDLLTRAAASDGTRHRRFLAEARGYTERLRDFFWTRALEQAARPTTGCASCASRMNFAAHAQIPRFVPAGEPAGQSGLGAQVLYLWLAALAAVGLLLRTPAMRLRAS